MKVIEIPGVGNVEFPDSMSDDAIATAAAKLHTDAQPAKVDERAAMALRAPAQGLTREGPASPPGLAARLVEMGQPMAHPQTTDEIGHLLMAGDAGKVLGEVPAMVRGAGRAIGKIPGAVRDLPVRDTAATVLERTGDMIAHPAITTGKVLKYVAGKIRPAEEAVEGVVSAPGFPRGGTTSAPAAPVPAPPVAAPVATTGTSMQPAAMPARPPMSPKAQAAVDEFTAARTARQPSNNLPDAKALNEARLAEIRAAYQASQQAAPAAAEKLVAVGGKMHVPASEFPEFMRLLKTGKSQAEALQALTTARELAAKLGGATDAEVAKAVKHMQATGKW